MDRWPHSVRTLVDLTLAARQPSYLALGPGLNLLYNDAFIPLLGHRHPAALGTPLREVWPEVWDEFAPVVADTLAGEAQYFVDRPVTILDDGEPSRRWFTFSWTPVRDDSGAVRGFFCAATETTAAVRANEEVQSLERDARLQCEQRYLTLFDAIDEGFCIVQVMLDERGCALDYRFVEVNRAFERQTGLANAAGHWMRELAPAHEQRWFDFYGRVAASGEPIRFVEHAQALGRWFDVYAFRVGRPEDRLVAIVFSDVTERKRAEGALREADRRKDEFLATLAHELRNPLSPLRSGLEIARLTNGWDPALRRTIDMMDRQLTHLVRLVDDLLDVGRISSGKLELRKEPLSLARVLSSSVEATAGLVQAHHHLLTRDPIDDDVQVLGDFDRLSQVFTNLLSNAARYTDPGGRIRIGVRRRGDEAVIDVTDTGIGIPEGEAEHVFDLFSQVRAHQGRTGGGLGIGLAIVKSVIARHGGRVEVASAGPGKGSSFRVHLPLLGPAERRGEQAAAGLPASPHRRRVVVADDNPDAASSLAELLRMLGHEAYTAEDGEQAVEAVRRVRPDVVLLDLGMPRVDGLEAARRIRQLPYGQDVLLVALTGWGQDADRRRTAQAGFDRHLVKPVDVSQLDELIAAGSPQRAV